MAKTTIEVTYQQGNNLLQMAAGARMPDKIGPLSMAYQERARADREICAFYSALADISPLLEREGKPWFGTEDAWVPDSEKFGIWKLVDPMRRTSIEISPEALRGLYWLLLIMASSDTDEKLRAKFGAGLIVSTVWPVAEQIGRAKQLRKHLGIDEKQSPPILSDDEIDAAAAKDKKPEPVASEK